MIRANCTQSVLDEILLLFVGKYIFSQNPKKKKKYREVKHSAIQYGLHCDSELMMASIDNVKHNNITYTDFQPHLGQQYINQKNGRALTDPVCM